MLRDRLDEPMEKATTITRKTLAWFPIRVWRHFLQHNGFLLAAGISYQSLFAIFAALYLAFAVAGFWLGASTTAVDGLIHLINSYVPNLISEDGLVTPEQVNAVAAGSTGVLVTTGIVAVVVAVWTAIGFLTYTRRGVRDIFGLPFDGRSYVLLKARDLFAAIIFGAALIAGAVLGSVATWAMRLVFSLVGLGDQTLWWQLLARTLSLIVAFAINAGALAALFKFLSGTSLRWRTILPGSALGGAAIAILQLGAGLLLSYTPSNPLLATFAILIGFLLWFRINGIVILVASAWIAVATKDRDIPLVQQTEEERIAAEHAALTVAAQVGLRRARERRDAAPWWSRWRESQRVAAAERELGELEANAPPPVVKRTGFLD